MTDSIAERRARHESAPEKACRHLLRHLDDAAALRTNVLVAALFAGADRRSFATRPGDAMRQVRRLVSLAADELRAEAMATASQSLKRQYQILSRCDLGGEEHGTVARALGLSMRQFYRDRRAMCSRVADSLLRASKTVAVPGVVVFDINEHALSRARTLRHLGERDQSVSLLTDIVRSAPSMESHIEALCELSDIALYECRLSEALNFLNEARARLSVATPTLHRSHKSAKIRIDAQQATVQWYLGNCNDEADSDATESIRLTSLSPIQSDRELAIQMLLRHGYRAYAAGDLEKAKSLIDRARSVLGIIRMPMQSLQVEFLVNSIAILSIRHEEQVGIASAVADALAITARNGFTELGLLVTAAASVDYQLRGDIRTSLDHLLGIASVASHVMSSLNLGMFHLRLGEALVSAGQGTQALRNLQDARVRLHQFPFALAIACALEAEIYLRAGRTTLAVSSAEAALHAAERMANGRLAGASLTVLAEANFAAGNIGQGSENVNDAIKHLQTNGHPKSLLRAYRLSAEMTRSRLHHKLASELTHSITSQAAQV